MHKVIFVLKILCTTKLLICLIFFFLLKERVVEDIDVFFLLKNTNTFRFVVLKQNWRCAIVRLQARAVINFDQRSRVFP